MVVVVTVVPSTCPYAYAIPFVTSNVESFKLAKVNSESVVPVLLSVFVALVGYAPLVFIT